MMKQGDGDIERDYWGRAWAKAIVEARAGNPFLKKVLQEDPHEAHKYLARTGFGKLDHPVIANVKFYEEDQDIKPKKFSEMDPATELTPIIDNEAGKEKPIAYNERKKNP